MTARRIVWLAGASGALACTAWTQSASPPAHGSDGPSLAELIKQHPNDDRVATWQVDQAAAALASLSADGADTSLLFGVPTAEQRQRGAEASRRAMALLEAAGVSAAASVRRLEDGMMGQAGSEPGAAQRAAASEAALARLVDVEQAQRVPYFRAVAQTLLAASSSGASRVQAAKNGAATLARLRLATPEAEAARRMMLVGAIVNGTVIGDEARRAARTTLDEIAAAGDALDATTRQRLAMARVLLSDDRGAGLGETATAQEREAGARRLMERARLDPASRTSLTAEACRVLLESAGLGPLHAGGADADRLRVYARVSEVIGADADTASLPPEAILARAVTLLRHDGQSQEARALLSRLAARSDIPSDVRAATLWEAGAAFSRDHGGSAQELAVECLDRFISEFATDERAPAAARTLEALAARALLAPGLSDSSRAALEDTQLRALDLLIAHPKDHPDEIDAWKAGAITIRTGRLDPATVTAAKLEPLVMQATTIGGAAAASAASAIDGLARRVFDDSSWSARPAKERVALIQTVRSMSGFVGGDRVALLAGEAKLAAGRDDASAELRPLIGGALDAPDQPTRVRVRLALAEALGDTPAGRAEAITLLRELVAPLDGAPSSAKRPAYYWRAWATVLEYLRADGADGKNDVAVRAQARRLELLDPAMGGPATAERIRRARDDAQNGDRPASGGAGPG